jgi:hypothetical protein
MVFLQIGKPQSSIDKQKEIPRKSDGIGAFDLALARSPRTELYQRSWYGDHRSGASSLETIAP